MLQILFVNITILVAFIFIVGQFTKNITLDDFNLFIPKVILGVVAGLIGVLLMCYSSSVSPTIFLDLRALPIILASMSGGLIGGCISAFVIIVGRLLFWEIHPQYYSYMITSMIMMGVVCGFISTMKISPNKKWLLMISFGLINAMASAVLVLDSYLGILEYFLIVLTSSLIVFLSSWYVNGSNILYRSLKELSTRDYLTGLQNARQLALILEECQVKNKDSVALLLIDIDHFKKINDTYGHIIGDTVLIELAKILTIFEGEKIKIFRKSGEEFVLLIQDMVLSQTISTAEAIRFQVANHIFQGETFQIQFTVSIGIAQYPETSFSMENLFHRADKALYFAKSSGRNCIKHTIKKTENSTAVDG